MSIRTAIGLTIASVFALTSVSDVALSQGRIPPKRPTVGGKPLVPAKPSAPMGCKLVGTVKGTKLWAGDCTAAPELRTTPSTSSDDIAPRPPLEAPQDVPKDQQ
jgi:hypothetical protein